MKRNIDVVRNLLMQVAEAQPIESGQFPFLNFYASDVTNEEVIYHVRLMLDQGLLYEDATIPRGQDHNGNSVAKFRPDALTGEGNEFLAAIQDDNVWKKTKSKVASVGGNATLDIFKRVATSIVVELLGSGG